MRRGKAKKRDHKPDAVYESVAVGRFINYLMGGGKKTVAERVVYSAFDIVADKSKKDALKVFEEALEHVTPSMEVISRRVGGANYQIPIEVRPERQFFLASSWIIDVVRAKKGRPIAESLADELLAAAINEGDAVKKKQNIHRIAEANRAFAHFARKRRK